MTLGERLKEEREKRGLTQQDVADEIGVTKQAIFSYEKGVRSPAVTTLCALAQFFEVTTDYLCGIAEN